MAPIPATITINWQSNYNGPHRVCWRPVGAPSYTCTPTGSHPNCGVGPCSYVIPITVDNETCTPVSYEGYVQAACETEASLNGRISFLITFTPSPACERYEAICQYSAVSLVNITNSGSGYNPIIPPNVVLSGGGGSGATVTALVGDGAITNLALTLGGTGYVDGFYPSTNLTGGSGIGATGDVTIAGGIVTSIVIVTPGNGYLNTEVLAPDSGVVGVPATAAQFTVTSDYGKIIAVTIVNQGINYVTLPNVVIDPPGAGTTALAVSVLQGCDSFAIPDCSGVSLIILPKGSLKPGQSTFVCGSNIPALPVDYSVVLNGNCLCNCEEVTITPVAGTTSVRYINCDNVAASSQMTATITNPLTVCVVVGSVTQTAVTPGASVSVVINGTCP